MKRKIYTPLLLTALFMSTLSQTVPGTTANAAKKPALSKTKVSVYTGKKAKNKAWRQEYRKNGNCNLYYIKGLDKKQTGGSSKWQQL